MSQTSPESQENGSGVLQSATSLCLNFDTDLVHKPHTFTVPSESSSSTSQSTGVLSNGVADCTEIHPQPTVSQSATLTFDDVSPSCTMTGTTDSFGKLQIPTSVSSQLPHETHSQLHTSDSTTSKTTPMHTTPSIFAQPSPMNTHDLVNSQTNFVDLVHKMDADLQHLGFRFSCFTLMDSDDKLKVSNRLDELEKYVKRSDDQITRLTGEVNLLKAENAALKQELELLADTYHKPDQVVEVGGF